MSRALLLVVLVACSRPVERTSAVPLSSRFGAPLDASANAPVDTVTIDAPTSVTATVSRVDVVGPDTLVVFAAGSDDGVQPSWRVTFVVDRAAEIPPCPVVRVTRHETICKWNQTFLPSRVVRIEP